MKLQNDRNRICEGGELKMKFLEAFEKAENGEKSQF